MTTDAAELSSLDQCKAEMVEAWEEIHQRAVDAIPFAIKLGQAALRAKEEIGHGEFGAWIEKNLPFSDTWARKCMNAATVMNAIGEMKPREQAKWDKRLKLEATTVEKLAAFKAEALGKEPKATKLSRVTGPETVTDVSDKNEVASEVVDAAPSPSPAKREKELDKREADLDKREAKLNALAEKLGAREAELKILEAALKEREKALKAKPKADTHGADDLDEARAMLKAKAEKAIAPIKVKAKKAKSSKGEAAGSVDQAPGVGHPLPSSSAAPTAEVFTMGCRGGDLALVIAGDNVGAFVDASFDWGTATPSTGSPRGYAASSPR